MGFPALPPAADLKPANVLLKGTRNSARGFSCKLADFGLSRCGSPCALSQTRATHMPFQGQLPLHPSPRQVGGQAEAPPHRTHLPLFPHPGPNQHPHALPSLPTGCWTGKPPTWRRAATAQPPTPPPSCCGRDGCPPPRTCLPLACWVGLMMHCAVLCCAVLCRAERCGPALLTARPVLRLPLLSPQPSLPPYITCGPPAHPAPAAWELVAGEEAYRGWHPMQIIMQVTQHGARPPALPHCPPALAALMARCWHEAPADKWGEGNAVGACSAIHSGQCPACMPLPCVPRQP